MYLHVISLLIVSAVLYVEGQGQNSINKMNQGIDEIRSTLGEPVTSAEKEAYKAQEKARKDAEKAEKARQKELEKARKEAEKEAKKRQKEYEKAVKAEEKARKDLAKALDQAEDKVDVAEDKLQKYDETKGQIPPLPYNNLPASSSSSGSSSSLDSSNIQGGTPPQVRQGSPAGSNSGSAQTLRVIYENRFKR